MRELPLEEGLAEISKAEHLETISEAPNGVGVRRGVKSHVAKKEQDDINLLAGLGIGLPTHLFHQRRFIAATQNVLVNRRTNGGRE